MPVGQEMHLYGPSPLQVIADWVETGESIDQARWHSLAQSSNETWSDMYDDLGNIGKAWSESKQKEQANDQSEAP